MESPEEIALSKTGFPRQNCDGVAVTDCRVSQLEPPRARMLNRVDGAIGRKVPELEAGSSNRPGFPDKGVANCWENP